MVDELSRQVTSAIQDKEYDALVAALLNLEKVKVVGNRFVNDIVADASIRTERHLSRLNANATEAAALGNFGAAESLIGELRTLGEKVVLESVASFIEELIQKSATVLAARRKQQESWDAAAARIAEMEAAVKSIEDVKNKLEMQLALVLEQQESQKLEIARLEAEREEVLKKADEDKKRLEESYTAQIGQLEQRKEGLSQEEQIALQKQVEKLQRDLNDRLSEADRKVRT